MPLEALAVLAIVFAGLLILALVARLLNLPRPGWRTLPGDRRVYYRAEGRFFVDRVTGAKWRFWSEARRVWSDPVYSGPLAAMRAVDRAYPQQEDPCPL